MYFLIHWKYTIRNHVTIVIGKWTQFTGKTNKWWTIHYSKNIDLTNTHLAQGFYIEYRQIKWGISKRRLYRLQQLTEKDQNLDQATEYWSLFKQTSLKQNQTLEQWFPLKKQVIFAPIFSCIQNNGLRSAIMTLTALLFACYIICNCIFFNRVCSQHKESSEAEKEVKNYISISTH